MVNVGQLQKGMQKYIETEIIDKMQGWQKWTLGAAAAIYLEEMPTLFKELAENPYIKPLGIVDETGMIDIDKAYEHIKRQAEKGPVSFNVPLIGALTINKDDVTKIYQMITSS